MKIKVNDISRAEMLEASYDIAFLALGYEPRCTYVSRLLDVDRVKETIIFAYSENLDSINRKESHSFFQKKWSGKEKFVDLAHSNVKEVYSVLNSLEMVSGECATKILIDYSAMSRNWYAAILNYFMRHSSENVIIDLVYSSAEYPISDDFYQFELGDIKILPGCEGSSITKSKKCAIFMLGFDSLGPQSFYNLLEPELSFGVIASPGALPDYENIALERNKEFIGHQLMNGNKLLRLPISSVSTTFEELCQLIQPLRNDYNISLIQFGPKPHIIASTLAGIFFDNVSCIYSEYNRSKPFEVVHNGDLVIARLDIKGNEA
ncbi:hypothetical protein SIL08_02555 [Scandinavium sp. V105_16]|uniref:Uncharacterized protein n=1 Tax=Scandinavium lactucae TaxID=3095028 RepID=A0AAJ2VTC9_9ENTR|nr:MULTISPECIES: hypothetical protein [unclassified Scandinavium]MDX6019171.1 hypothetical protein [Scandinavium sp. V105_16]MDX6030673.1 hypothetical protein [Scandinavium sp. V105_12]